MTRTILGLVAAVSISSAAYAIEGMDGDNNPVPSASEQVNNSGLALERSYGAAYRQVPPARVPSRPYWTDPEID